VGPIGNGAARGKFRFSLMSLILATWAMGAGLGVMIIQAREWARRSSLAYITRDVLDQITSTLVIYSNHPPTKEVSDPPEWKFPAALAEFTGPGYTGTDAPAELYTAPRFAEYDVGFCTIAGLSTKDVGKIWLYENVPPEATGLERFVLRIGTVAQDPLNGHLVETVLMPDADFRRALAETLALPGTKVVENDRRKDGHGWLPGVMEIRGNKLLWLGPPHRGPHDLAGRYCREPYEFGTWKRDVAPLYCLGGISILCFLALIWRSPVGRRLGALVHRVTR